MTYLYLSSKDSVNIHPRNTAEDFTIELPISLQLDELWECALLSINRKNVDVYCDWCRPSIIHGGRLPVLSRVKNRIDHPQYVPVNAGQKLRIQLYIRDIQTGSSPVSHETSWCTLHLRRQDAAHEIST